MIWPTSRRIFFPYTTLFRSEGRGSGCKFRVQGGGRLHALRRRLQDHGGIRPQPHPVAAPSHAVVDVRNELPAELRSEEHTSELQSRPYLVCHLPRENKIMYS